MKTINPPFCPRLKGDSTGQCALRVTGYYFRNFCNTSNFKGCNQYAAIMKELKTPMNWLQKTAISQGGRTPKAQDKR